MWGAVYLYDVILLGMGYGKERIIELSLNIVVRYDIINTIILAGNLAHSQDPRTEQCPPNRPLSFPSPHARNPGPPRPDPLRRVVTDGEVVAIGTTTPALVKVLLHGKIANDIL